MRNPAYIERLRRENERLRRALQQVVRKVDDGVPPSHWVEELRRELES